MKFKLLLVLLFSSILFSKEISVKTEDGFTLKGWMYFPAKDKTKYPLALIAHQFGSDHKRWVDFAKELRDMGYATLNVDLRGHGESIHKNSKKVEIKRFANLDELRDAIKISTKRVGFKNLVSDLSAWIDFVESNYKNVDLDNKIFIGASLGAGALIGTMFEYEPKMAVLFSPGNFKNSGGDGELSEIEAPVMIITSQKDMAFKRAIKYTKDVNLPTSLILSGNGHGEALLGRSKKFVKIFIDRYK